MSKDGTKSPWYESSMVRKVHKWYETSMVRKVYGTKSLVPPVLHTLCLIRRWAIVEGPKIVLQYEIVVS